MLQMCSIKVLVAHSDPFMSAGLAAVLGKREDFEVVVAGPTAAVSGGITPCTPSADVVVADYESGLRLAASRGQWKDRVVIFTSNDREAKICRALEQGVRGYVLYGCGPHDGYTSVVPRWGRWSPSVSPSESGIKR
jgi:DNA-binding NarL/FixJ family response regulator